MLDNAIIGEIISGLSLIISFLVWRGKRNDRNNDKITEMSKDIAVLEEKINNCVGRDHQILQTISDKLNNLRSR